MRSTALNGQRSLEARDTTFVISIIARVKRFVGSAPNEVATSGARRRGSCCVLDRFCSDKTGQRRSGRDAVSGSHVVSILVSLLEARCLYVTVQEAPSQMPGGRGENKKRLSWDGIYRVCGIDQGDCSFIGFEWSQHYDVRSLSRL